MAALALAAGVLLACAGDQATSPAGSDADPLFQTDSLQYSLRAGSIGYEARLLVTYTNRTARATSFSNCRGGVNVELEKFVDGQWKWAWSPVMLMCYSQPIVVPPGGTYVLPIAVFGGYPDCRCGPQFNMPEVTGIYRAVWRGGFDVAPPNGGTGSDSLPESARVSNQFLLVAMPR